MYSVQISAGAASSAAEESVTVSSEVARLERLAGAPSGSLTDTSDKAPPSAPLWPPRSRGATSENQIDQIPLLSRRTNEDIYHTASTHALVSAQQMSREIGNTAAEPVQLQDPDQPTAAQHTGEAHSNPSEADSGQLQRPSQRLEMQSPSSQSSYPSALSSPARTLDRHPDHGTPLQSSLGASFRQRATADGQRATADGEPAPRAAPRGAPIMPSIRAPIAGPILGATPGFNDGATPAWVPLSTLGLKGPPFPQQLAAQGAPTGQRRTKQERLETTFARAKARLQAMHEVRAFPCLYWGPCSSSGM